MKILSLDKTNTEELRSILLQQLEEELKNVGTTRQINMKYNVADLFKLKTDQIKKPFVIFSYKAWTKLRALTMNYKHEVACHGVVQRKDNIFTITDVLVYPQRTNNSHVESDDDKYPAWLMGLDDGTINNLRFQYHSHYNFAVNPSATDTEYYDRMAASVEDYYIFMIGNQTGEFTNKIWVYDKIQNVIFEPDDISWNIGRIGTFLAESKPLVAPMPVAVAPVTAPPKPYLPYDKYNAQPATGGYVTDKRSYWERQRDEEDALYAKRYANAHTQQAIDDMPKIDRRRKEWKNYPRKEKAQ